MAKTALYNMEGAAIGEIELSDAIFASDVNVAAMHLVVWPHSARARRVPRPARKSAAVVARSTVRRAPAMLVIMATALRSSVTAASCSRPSPAIM